MMKQTRKAQDDTSSAKTIEAAAEACLKGEMSCGHLRSLVCRELENIARSHSSAKDPTIPAPVISSESPATDVPPAQRQLETLRQALRSIVGKLVNPDHDPLDDIYTLGAQIIEDFCHSHVLPPEESEKLWVFRELADESALLADEDPTLTSVEASRLRSKIQQAATDYLKAKKS